jgi:hypothetical protein
MKFTTVVSIPTAVVELLRGSGHNVVRAIGSHEWRHRVKVF